MRRAVLREWREHVAYVRPLRAICVRMRNLLLARAFDSWAAYPAAVRAHEDATVRAALLNWATPLGRAFRTWVRYDARVAREAAREAAAAAAAAERDAAARLLPPPPPEASRPPALDPEVDHEENLLMQVRIVPLIRSLGSSPAVRRRLPPGICSSAAMLIT